MSAGLNWDEWTARYDDPENVFVNMINSPDPVFYVLNRPLANEPGTTFTYNTGLPIIMGKIISNASGMSLDEFATEYLFTPLGIDSHLWYTYGNNTNSIGSSLRITPRDMAKFGLLCLNHGIWNGQQIVSEEWLATATTSRFSPWNGTYYGYYWWKVPFYRDGQRIEEYGAHGRAGQYIFILPELDIVAVFTSWNDNELYDEPLTIMQDYILPSVE